MRMTGGEAVVRSLAAHDVDTVFGIPGTHNLGIYDALRAMGGIRHILARHEQGAAFMADGYARASGEVGVCMSTTGPAALNTLASLGTAFSDSSPVLCIASQIPAEGIGLDKGYLHECQDQLGSFAPVTKWRARADTVAEIPGVMREAFAQMQNGRPRPTAVEIPCDTLDESDEVTIPTPAAVSRLSPDPEQVERAARLLGAARQPVIWAGGGVIGSEAGGELRQLAERLQVPIFTTVLGKGAIADDHPLVAGATILHPAAQAFLAKSDLMLAVGTRFTEEETDRWGLRMPDTLIHIDIDPEEIDRNYTATVGVVGDARIALQLINAQLQEVRGQENGLAGGIAQLRQKVWRYCQERAPEGVELVQTLRKALPRETIIVSDLTVAAYWCRRLLDVYEPRTNIYPWGFCTLGFGLPAAIGAKVAQTGPTGGGPLRRWWIHVQLPGIGSRSAAGYADCHNSFQRLCIRCSAAATGGTVRASARGRPCKPGLRRAGGGVRRRRLPRRFDRATWACRHEGDRSGPEYIDRAAGNAAVADYGSVGAHV